MNSETSWQIDQIDEPEVIRDAVPCDGCTRCCHGDAVRIFDDEDASPWKTEPHRYFTGKLMLAHKPNGACYYLDDSGCSIHHDKPRMCREMDCRNIAMHLSYTGARKANVRLGVWKKGRELLAKGG